MKKIAALLVSVVMACGFCAGCGDSDSSSKSDASSKGKSTASTAQADPDTEGKHLAEVYTDALKNKTFSLKMTTSSDFMGETPMVLEMFGDDLHYEMSFLGVSLNVYKIGDTTYVLDTASKSFCKDDTGAFGEDAMGTNQSMGIDDSYTFVSSENADGYIIETYSISNQWELSEESGVEITVDSTEDDSDASTAKYYFDESTKELVKIESTAMGMTSTTTIDTFKTDITGIELPEDFDSWTELSTEEFGQLLQNSMGDMGGALTDDADVEEGGDEDFDF